MYTPGFTEIYIGLVVIILWARWLRERPVPRAVVAALPWVAGAAVIGGQLFAVYGMVAAAGSQPLDTPVSYGRWGSFGVVVGVLLVLLGMTTWSFVARKESPAS